MQAFETLTATAVPLRMENVDTDQIIPAKYLTAVTKDGMGGGLFSWIRYNADGSPKADFVLNKPQCAGCEILIAGRNFGSGSSREHAVWALTDYGFRCVISPGFADIFYNNSLKNGLLLIKLDAKTVDRLFKEVEGHPGYRLAVDLEAQTVTAPGGESIKFDIDPFAKHSLLNGLDEIGITLENAGEIKAFEARHRASQPWLFG
jgi:3-isopropylmalate/(R)-2-methylmalate dehydratase small subunit